ncbi:hypothetical protein B0H17DRAFT_1101485 [Mycena rosella]|uniref:Secreted protein n=1 Tax=Mycena rosella TaxID=1033263 RepID=A0AAD7FZV4_MYCRO|nr:hypothetical protein B0H17DRAFT_1101485 [Mycena rosella]
MHPASRRKLTIVVAMLCEVCGVRDTPARTYVCNERCNYNSAVDSIGTRSAPNSFRVSYRPRLEVVGVPKVRPAKNAQPTPNTTRHAIPTTSPSRASSSE